MTHPLDGERRIGAYAGVRRMSEFGVIFTKSEEQDLGAIYRDGENKGESSRLTGCGGRVKGSGRPNK